MKQSKKIAIIGSSPISLFEAIYQDKLGNQVTVFDEKKQIGGAWANINYGGELDVELGCHIWDVDKKTYTFIERFIGEALIALQPAPTIIFRNKSFPYDWKNNLLVFKAIRHDLKSFLFGKKFIKPVLFSRKYKYPRKGSNQLLEKLKTELKQTKIEFNLNQVISNITIKDDLFYLKDNVFDELILTSLSGIKSIQFNNDMIELKHNDISFTHFHFIIKKGIRKKISYVRTMDHEFIHRVSDISFTQPGNDYIFAIGIFTDKLVGKSDEAIVDIIKNYMIDKKWLDKDVEICKFYKNQFNAKIIDHFQIKEVKEIKGLDVLRSSNFIFGLGNNVERWSEVLFSEQ